MAESVSDSTDRMLQEILARIERMQVESRKRRQKELDDRTLLIKIHQLVYEIPSDVLDQVFAEFGGIEYLEVCSADDEYHSKIRFQSTYSANRAFYSLNHRNIYDGCCRLELFRVTEVVGEQEIETPIEDLREGMDSSTPIVDDSGEQENPDERPQSPPSNLDEESAKTSYTGSDLIKMMNERTILVKIHLEWYPISCEVLDQVFSGIGNWKSIEILSPEDEFHSRICFQDRESAVRALESMNLKYIYTGCCRMELFLEAEIVDRTSKIESSNQKISEDSVIDEQGKQAPDFTVGNELQGCQADLIATVDDREFWTEIQNQYGYSKVDELMEFPHIVKDSEFPGIDVSNRLNDESKNIGVSIQQIVDNSGEQEFSCDSLTLSSTTMIDAEIEIIDKNCLRNLVKIESAEVSSDKIDTKTAHQVFDEKPDREVKVICSFIQLRVAHQAFGHSYWIFDPGGTDIDAQDVVLKSIFDLDIVLKEKVPIESCIKVCTILIFVFDPGGFCLYPWIVKRNGWCYAKSSCVNSIGTSWRLGCIWIFGSGGIAVLVSITVIRLLGSITCYEKGARMELSRKLLLVVASGSTREDATIWSECYICYTCCSLFVGLNYTCPACHDESTNRVALKRRQWEPGRSCWMIELLQIR